MNFEDLKIGQHLWVMSNNKLLLVAKFDEHKYQVCGDWEGGIDKKECKIIELIKFPKGYENTKLYYL